MTASSIGVLLKAGGWRVTSIKIDPYINIDAGTMSPFEHGEVFVLDDGGEADLDLGNYERFVDSTLTRDHNITTGKIYQSVIAKERKGEYLGKTVQVGLYFPRCVFRSKYRVARVSTQWSSRVPNALTDDMFPPSRFFYIIGDSPRDGRNPRMDRTRVKDPGGRMPWPTRCLHH